MAEEFNVDFESEEAARRARRSSGDAGRRRARDAREARGHGLRGQCMVWTPRARHDARARRQRARVPFFDLFYRLDLLKSGQHHPDGLLWIHTPARRH